MYAEGETELRDFVVQKLEASGFLNKIKAEMRASVLLAFEEEEGNLRKKNPLSNEKLENFLKTEDGQVAVSIVREFLECFNMKYTLSVFDPEISNVSGYLSREKLCKKLNVSENEGSVLSLLLRKSGSDSSSKNLQSQIHPEKCISSTSKETVHNSNEPSTKTLPDTINQTSGQTAKSAVESSTSIFQKTNSDVSEVKENVKLEPLAINLSERRAKNSSLFSNTPVLNNLLQSADLLNDPFFDEPLTTEKQSYKLSATKSNTFNENTLYKANTNPQTSLQNLPALTTKSEEWTFGKELPQNTQDLKKNMQQKKESEQESNESSDHQLNSESIEEDLEEYSAAEDLSSLSQGEDATSDQTVSQTSVVDGVDHIEPCDKVAN